MSDLYSGYLRDPYRVSLATLATLATVLFVAVLAVPAWQDVEYLWTVPIAGALGTYGLLRVLLK